MKTIVYSATVIAWLLTVIGYGLWSITHYLKHPTDGDLYAHHVGFQVMSFAVMLLPIFVAGLIVILFIEKSLLEKRAT